MASSLVVGLVLLACTATPTPVPIAEARALLGQAKKALLALERYRYTTALTVRAPDREPVSLLVEGEVTKDPPATHVRILNPKGDALQAEWVRVGSQVWVYDAERDTWRAAPAEVAQGPLSIVEPEALWRALPVDALTDVRAVGTATLDGRAVVQYHFGVSDVTAFAQVAGLSRLMRAEGETWIDLESDIPLRTILRLEGGEEAEGFARLEIASTIRDVRSAEIRITPPARRLPTPTGNGHISPVFQTLDGVALPLYPDRAPVSGSLPSPLAGLVQNALTLAEQPEVAVQLYSAVASPAEVRAFFEGALPEAGWAVEQAFPGGYTDNAYTFVVSKGDVSGHVLLLPRDKGHTVVITTLQRR